jgi:hypothetical protein
MKNRYRIAAFATALVTSFGTIAAAATTPAQAWSYCTFTPPAGLVTFTADQGYCGNRVSYNVVQGACVYLGQWANWAGSVLNKSPRGIIVTDTSNCTGSASAALPAGNTHPNLYSINGINLGDKVSAFYVA